jgi:hypothetical protein
LSGTGLNRTSSVLQVEDLKSHYCEYDNNHGHAHRFRQSVLLTWVKEMSGGSLKAGRRRKIEAANSRTKMIKLSIQDAIRYGRRSTKIILVKTLLMDVLFIRVPFSRFCIIFFISESS